MSHFKKTLSVAAAAVLLAASLVSAQNEQRTTKVTFSGPVSLPGVTLPAGTYTFKIANLQTTRHVVHVYNEDQTQVYATVIAVAAERQRPADDTVITFRETPSDMPPAVRYWYYPGDTIGQEFAYPKQQAIQLANATGESVLAIDADPADPDAMRTGEITRVSPASPAEQEARTASDAAPAQEPARATSPTAAPSAQPTSPAAVPSAQPPADASARPADVPSPQPPASPAQAEQQSAASAQTDRARATTTGAERPTDTAAASEGQPTGTSGRLPKTASELPLVGLIGLLALGGALVTRALSRSIA